LTRIETEAFARTGLDCVVVPEKVSFIAADAFPRDCAVTVTDVQDAHFVAVSQPCPLRTV
jgi:siroheme synthase